MQHVPYQDHALPPSPLCSQHAFWKKLLGGSQRRHHCCSSHHLSSAFLSLYLSNHQEEEGRFDLPVGAARKLTLTVLSSSHGNTLQQEFPQICSEAEVVNSLAWAWPLLSSPHDKTEVQTDPRTLRLVSGLSKHPQNLKVRHSNGGGGKKES